MEIAADAVGRVVGRRPAFSHAGLIWTLVRTDFKARRVIDDREVFRDRNARLKS